MEQNKRLVEAQSTPLLMLESSNLNDAHEVALSFKLTNVGTGPAQVIWFHLTDDQGVSYAGGTLYERVHAADPKATFVSQQISGSLMRSGERRTVFEWPKPAEGSPATGDWATLNRTRFGLQGSACYCSMFDECRVTDFTVKKPKVVASCEDR